MRLLLFLALVVGIGAASLHGEAYGSSVAQKSSGTFRGVIVDANGKRIRGASVTVEGPDLKREITPNREAYFEIDLPVGTYKITVKKAGYVPYQLTDLEVKSGGEFSHVFRLEPSRVQSAIRNSTCVSRCDA
jgi:hypothetical protein